MPLRFLHPLVFFMCFTLFQAYGQVPLNEVPNQEDETSPKDSVLNHRGRYQNGSSFLKVGTRDRFYKGVKSYDSNGKIDYTSITPANTNTSDSGIGNTASAGNHKWNWWYKDGKPKEQGAFTSNQIGSEQDTLSVRTNYLIQSFWDSTGIQLVKDGNGQWYDLYPGGQLKIKGNYVNGLPDGEWIGFYQNGKPYFIEQYKEGKLIKGKAYSGGRMVSTYTIEFSKPEYKGGLEELMQFLAHRIRYPKEAQQMGDQGTVFVEIIIDKKGKVTNPSILKGVSPACDAEALRLVSQLPDWKPGQKKGQPVAVKYVLPIRYILDN